MKHLLTFVLFYLLLFPLPSKAAESILEPLYSFMDYFYSEQPQTVDFWNTNQFNSELNSIFYKSFSENNLHQAYLKKYTPPSRATRTSNGSISYPYDESTDAYLPAPAILWLREKIGVRPQTKILDISLHVNGSLSLYDDGYQQPIWVTLQLNDHLISLLINWQQDFLHEVPTDILVLWTIDGEDFYAAAKHDAQTMCVKCWFE